MTAHVPPYVTAHLTVLEATAVTELLTDALTETPSDDQRFAVLAGAMAAINGAAQKRTMHRAVMAAAG